jgi:TATA-box binding protein (TBP) (component of TFIID and TFIIIB)
MSESHFSKNLHISAMVQIGELNTKINLENLAHNLDINKNIYYIEYGSQINKGINTKKFSKKKSESRKYFYNQITIHIFNELKENKRVNVKLFNNGRVQMTGINSNLIGETTLEIVIQELNQLNNKSIIFDMKDDTEEIKSINDLETVLINSDFDIGSEINREILHRHIIENGFLSSFEPCNYPGVNIKYYMNPLRNNYGICDCEKPCNGKGKDNSCKRITIAVFKSGKIIITGGRNKNQIQTAYEFITEFINDNREEILVKN